MNQIKTATESYDAMLRRLALAQLAGLAAFCLVMTAMANLVTNLTAYSIASVLLVSLAFAGGTAKAVASRNLAERRRIAIGLSGVVILFGTLLALNQDLLTGNVGLASLRAGVEQATCKQPVQVGRGYTPLEPCMTAGAITAPSFSSTK